VRLSDLRSETKAVTVHFDAGDLKVTYRPNAFTADASDKVQAAMQDPTQQTDAMFQMIGGMLVDWDLEDNDGNVIDLHDVAQLRAEVPMNVFGRIFMDLSEDQNPGEAPRR
jgi:hypothetical protein